MALPAADASASGRHAVGNQPIVGVPSGAGFSSRAEGEDLRIIPAQASALDTLPDDAFKREAFRFFRAVFPDRVASLDDAALGAQISLGMRDAARLGDQRRGTVLTVLAVRLLRPDIINSDRIWQQFMDQHELAGDPRMRGAILEAYLTSDFGSLAEREAYHAALDRFWTGDY